MTQAEIEASAGRIMQIVEECRVTNNERPFTEEQERETLKKVLEAILREVAKLVVKDTIEDVMECLSQQKPTDMN